MVVAARPPGEVKSAAVASWLVSVCVHPSCSICAGPAPVCLCRAPVAELGSQSVHGHDEHMHANHFFTPGNPLTVHTITTKNKQKKKASKAHLHASQHGEEIKALFSIQVTSFGTNSVGGGERAGELMLMKRKDLSLFLLFCLIFSHSREWENL